MIAVGHTLPVMMYHVQKKGTTYTELGLTSWIDRSRSA
jgi:hypothetical protein